MLVKSRKYMTKTCELLCIGIASIDNLSKLSEFVALICQLSWQTEHNRNILPVCSVIQSSSLWIYVLFWCKIIIIIILIIADISKRTINDKSSQMLAWRQNNAVVNFIFIPVLLKLLNVCVSWCYNSCGNHASGGYGSATLNVWRQLCGTMHRGSEFPLTLGRDFSGDIVDMGCGVDRRIYRTGDSVSRA